jgi:hypothetical protein
MNARIKRQTATRRIARGAVMPYRVMFSTIANLDDCEETEAVTEVHGEINHLSEDQETTVGCFHGWCIRTDRVVESGETFFDVCDRTSQELCDVASLVWDMKEDGYRAELDLGTPIGNLMVASTIEIAPEHRGKGVGLLTLYRFIDYFGGGAAIAVLKPHPMHEQDPAVLRRGIAKLKSHWSQLGFGPIPNSCSGRLDASSYFFLDMAQQRPALEDLLQRKRTS